MTKFRATFPFLACATALALSAATTAAASFSELQGYTTEIKVIEDLPAPPKLAAPQAGPSAPRTAGKEMDRANTPLAQFSTNGSTRSPVLKKPLKLK